MRCFLWLGFCCAFVGAGCPQGEGVKGKGCGGFFLKLYGTSCRDHGRSLQGCRSGGLGVLIPWKYVGWVRVSSDPLKCHILSFKQLLDNSVSFTSSRMKDCQKWKIKLIFRGARNTLMAWPDWHWSPYFIFTTDLRHWFVYWSTDSFICTEIYLCVSVTYPFKRLHFNKLLSQISVSD